VAKKNIFGVMALGYQPGEEAGVSAISEAMRKSEKRK